MDVELSPDQNAALQRFLMENSVVELRSDCTLLPLCHSRTDSVPLLATVCWYVVGEWTVADAIAH
jgi:hypothetical protein